MKREKGFLVQRNSRILEHLKIIGLNLELSFELNEKS